MHRPARLALAGGTATVAEGAAGGTVLASRAALAGNSSAGVREQASRLVAVRMSMLVSAPSGVRIDPLIARGAGPGRQKENGTA
jgi:hypothetical protein